MRSVYRAGVPVGVPRALGHELPGADLHVCIRIDISAGN